MPREWLRRLLRRPKPGPGIGPDALPPERSDDAKGWLMERVGDGVKRHFPRPSRVERGPAVDPLAPIPQTPEPPQGVRFRAAGNRHDGTAGRLP